MRGAVGVLGVLDSRKVDNDWSLERVQIHGEVLERWEWTSSSNFGRLWREMLGCYCPVWRDNSTQSLLLNGINL